MFSQNSFAQYHVGNIKGTPMVDAKGMFGYSIPIDLVKAPNQSDPNLQLAYHSGLASFSLTSGWYFTTSSISVCHPEDKSNALEYGDIYCHNGEELVFNSSTNFYQKKITDHNRYQRTSRGFILQKKNGEKEYYESIQGNNPSEAITWYLTKKEDLRSNFIEYEYLNDSKVQLKSISYGGNIAANLPHQYRVEIIYSKISNLLTKYSHGQETTEQHIPNSIRIVNFGKVMYSYKLTWNETGSGYFLESISKCVSNGECLPPLKIKYQTFDKSSFNEKSLGSQFTLDDFRWDSSTHIRLPIDLNSDGSLDVLGIGPRKLHISYGNKGDFGTRHEINHPGLNNWNRKLPIQLSDVNLDGFIDILAFNPNGFEYINGEENGFNSDSKSYSFFEGILRSDALRELDDINLDGYPDIIALQKDGVYVSYYSPQNNSFNQPILFTDAFSYQIREPNWPIYYIDVNGDGVKDFLSLQKDGVKVSLRNSNGFTQPETWSTDRQLSPSVSDDIHIGLSDYNMDGYIDIYVINQRGLHVSFNTGTSYTDPVLLNRNLNSAKYPRSRTTVVSKDIDRDGQIDFIATNSSKISVLFGTLIRDINDAIVDFPTSYRGFDPSKHLFYLGDVENNAKDDLIIFHDNLMYRYEFDSTSSKISEVIDSFENRLIVNWGITDNLNTSGIAISNDEFITPFYYNFDVVKSLQTEGSSTYSERVNYEYSEPLYHIKNGKFLGFKERSERTNTKNIRSKTEFKLLPQVNRLVEANSQLFSQWENHEIILSKTEMEWKVRKSSNSYEILLAKKTENSWDNNSRHLSTSTEEFFFDSYMNQTHKTSTKKDPFGT